MTVIDLQSLAGDTVLPVSQCDLCIIGSGPAGSTIAQELKDTKLRITLLESGGLTRSADADALNEIENVGRPRASDQWSVRNRILGGSSHTWGGRCAGFDEIDFKQRPWIPNSGWPIEIKDLEPYLDRGARHLGLAFGSGFSDERFWAIAGRRSPQSEMDPSLLLPFFWQFSRDDEESYPYEYMRFGRHLPKHLGSNTTLVTGATVTRIHTVDAAKAVKSVEFATLDGHRQTLTASAVVLCAGGIENARILLNSDTIARNGLGNDHDQVGRYLMDHLRGPVATFELSGSDALQKRFGRYQVSGRLFRAGFRLSPDLQRREELLNCAAWLGEVRASDDPWDAMRRIVGGKPDLPKDAVNLVLNSRLLMRGLKDYFNDRNGVPRKLAELNLDAMCEQVPDAESRVTLSKRRDRLAVRLPRLDWRSHSEESRCMRRMAELVADQLHQLGLPRPALADWVLDKAEIPTSFVDVAHPTGTTRMSDDPARGVVDANCEVHGVSGLFVSGSSVFPTAGHCNPTQMIVAMAVRLADHLKTQDARAAPTRVMIDAGSAGR